MDWIIGLLLLAVGIVIGFFVAKNILQSNSQAQANEEKELTAKEVLAQQSVNHINDSREMLNNIETQCVALKQQLDSYQSLLAEDTRDDSKLTYFGDQASAYLQNKQPERKRKEADKTDYQPRDYTDGSSGLFDGTKNKQAESTDI